MPQGGGLDSDMPFHFLTADLDNLRGVVEYVHDGTIGNRCAFLKNEAAYIRLLVPRSLGVTYAAVEIYNESHSRLVVRGAMEWMGISDDFDVYLFCLDTTGDAALYFYRFALSCICGDIFGYKCGTAICFSHEEYGEMLQLSVSNFKYESPVGRSSGVIYHIFVDRFCRGDSYEKNIDEGKIKKKAGDILVDDWSCGVAEYPSYPGAELKNNTFYGGNLYGIIDKLDYIASLGVTLIYLSPVFEAASNHKYDTGDYMSVDPLFGGDEALKLLITEAGKRNIGIILDGVFNHTGADSKYFNKFGNYDSVGAYQSKESEYFPWYEFKSYPDKYTSWWGIDILPRINPCIRSCSEYFIGEGGVVDKYARMGIAGMRLDVADELPDEFISGIKSRLNAARHDSILYGEVWEDASNKIAYDKRKKYYLGDELDGVMNYPLRKGIVDFILGRGTDTLEYALTDIINNAPKRIGDMQMNLLGTHDTERILTVLGGESADGHTNDYLYSKRMTADERNMAKARLMMAYTILATLPGIPAVFYGDEAGIEGYSDPFNRLPYPWGHEDAELLTHYRKVGSIRSNGSVYSDGDLHLLELTHELLVFARSKDDQVYYTVINNSDKRMILQVERKAKFNLSGINSRQMVLPPNSGEVFSTAASCGFVIL